MSTIDSAYWAWLDQVHKNNGCNRYVVSPMEAFAAGVSYGMGRVVPEGWKLVPLEPTAEMLSAQIIGSTRAREMSNYKNMGAVDGYQALLAAAPSWEIKNG